MAKNIGVRFDSPTQIERIKRAAKVRKWSFNQFVVEAAEDAAREVARQVANSEKEAVPVQQ